MRFRIEVEREEDGRWLAEVLDLPGVMAYGATRDAALSAVEALALQVVADKIEHGRTRADDDHDCLSSLDEMPKNKTDINHFASVILSPSASPSLEVRVSKTVCGCSSNGRLGCPGAKWTTQRSDAL